VHPKAGRSTGYILGLAAIFIYYIFLTASDALAEATSVLPAFLAAWLPNLCMGSLTIVLVQRTASDAPQLDMTRLWEGSRRLWRRWR
jgi:lipopolysaccharide export LptBFGC system permease protein LptF